MTGRYFQDIVWGFGHHTAGLQQLTGSIRQLKQSNTTLVVLLIPLRGVLGAGARAGPCASACPSVAAPAPGAAAVPGWFCRSCCSWRCRMASSRRLLRLTATSSCSAVCWLITCSTTSPSPEDVIKQGDQEHEWEGLHWFILVKRLQWADQKIIKLVKTL